MNSGIVSQIFSASDTAGGSVIERLEFAGVNTILGMGTVFVVLIFISFVISRMKYIPKFLERFEKFMERFEKKADIPAPVQEVVVPVVREEAEVTDLSDDLELVAVITAAIQASMGDEVPADGLIVKSIRRINNRKWQNAQ